MIYRLIRVELHSTSKSKGSMMLIVAMRHNFDNRQLFRAIQDHYCDGSNSFSSPPFPEDAWPSRYAPDGRIAAALFDNEPPSCLG